MSDEVFNMDKEISRFQTALIFRWLKSKKDFAYIAGQNFGGVIKNSFGLTPPMWSSFIRPDPGVKSKGGGVKVDFAAGRRASDRTIATDIAMATWTLKDAGKFKNKDIPSKGMEIVSAYLKCRNSRKRYARGFPRQPISEKDRNKLSDFLHNRQGYTPGGWVEAARYFLVPVSAAWVRRWGTKHKGKAFMNDQPGFIHMYAANPTKHHASKQIQGNIAIAIRMQVSVIYRDFEWWMNDNLTNL